MLPTTFSGFILRLPLPRFFFGALNLPLFVGSGFANFGFSAKTSPEPPTWTKLQVRTSCDGDALIALRLDVFPLVDEAADVLDLLLALPWLPPTALFPHIRNRLMEDLLVDLCELEGSDSDVEGTADEGPREPAPLCRKRAKAAE